MNRRWVSIIGVLWAAANLSVFSQAYPSTGTGGATQDSPSPSPSAASDADKSVSQNLDDARQALKYGIDSTVISVIVQATQSKDNRLAEDLRPELESINSDVQKATLDYYIAINDFRVRPRVEELLADYINYGSNVVIEMLKLLQASKDPAGKDLAATLIDLSDASKPEIQSAAVDTIAAIGTVDQVPALIAMYQKTSTPLTVRASILKAFGTLKTPDAYKLVKDTASDTAEDKTLRYEALTSLGKNGQADSIPAISKSLVSADVFERGAAIGALGGFALDQVQSLYNQALRDSYWRNRLNVLNVIATKKAVTFLDATMYVASHDPEIPVRQEAYRTVAGLDQAAGWDFMNKQLVDEKTGSDFRPEIAELIIGKHLDASLETIRTVFQNEYKKDNSAVLQTICRELSRSKNPGLADFYQKMLAHSDPIIVVYGIRGIQFNALTQFYPDLKAMLDKKPLPAVRASIQDALK